MGDHRWPGVAWGAAKKVTGHELCWDRAGGVQGDEGTGRGADKEREVDEAQLAKRFEIKVRGRLGKGCSGPNEIRILNRIVRVDDTGLHYEADPRHCDIIAESLNISKANSVCSPGIKNTDPDSETQSKSDAKCDPTAKLDINCLGWCDAQNLPELLCAMTGDHNNSTRRISFNPVVSSHGIPPSPCFPGLFATRGGWRSAPRGHDKFTGMPKDVVLARRQTLCSVKNPERIREHRLNIIRIANGSLAGDEVLISADPVICAARTRPVAKAKFQKRKGARQVKDFERAKAMADGSLTPESATLYRALSARANFLAQDRVDVSFSSKELCREFAVPNEVSFGKLKRLGRYCVGRPRLVYHFPFQSPVEHIDTYVDTDFAGCAVTRRSTSGGVSTIGSCCVKHWSKTQSTIALSSGEAELGGIAYGTAQALGLQSVCRDLGMDLKVRIHSDATAAIGIVKRRGLGRIRHLATADLWIQEKVRCGHIEILKILGKDNPGDVLTKYVDKSTMENALQKLSMSFEEGRSAIAPQIMGKSKAEPSSPPLPGNDAKRAMVEKGPKNTS